MFRNKDILPLILALLGLGGFILFFHFFEDELRVSSLTGEEQRVLMDPLQRGKRVARACMACHDLTSAQKTGRVGPPLWHVVGRPAGSFPGYSYSKAHKEQSASLVWNEETLDRYLTNPKAFMPGNKMAFAGIRVAAERALLIQYLKTLREKKKTRSGR